MIVPQRLKRAEKFFFKIFLTFEIFENSTYTLVKAHERKRVIIYIKENDPFSYIFPDSASQFQVFYLL